MLAPEKGLLQLQEPVVPTCGKKLTDQWIEKQKTILPDTKWQHITFTMPSELWGLFRYNR